VHGKALLKSMNYAQALTEYAIAARSPRTAKEAHYFRGYALQQMGDLPRAQSELLVVAKEDEHYGDARIRVAKIMVRSPNLQEAIWGGQWVEHEVGETQDHASADAYYVLGVREVRLGHVDEAAKYLQHAVSVEPGHLEATKDLAMALLMQDDVAQAERVVLTLPLTAEHAETTGEFYRLTGNLTRAEEWFRKALEQDQKSAFATVNLADTLWLLGKREESINLLERLYTGRVIPFEHLHALAALANGKAAQAVTELTALSEGSDSGPDAHGRLVAALLSGKQTEAAKTLADTRIAAARQDPRALLDRVAVSLTMGLLTSAGDDLTALEARGINSDVCHYLTGALAFRQGDRTRARHETAEAVSRNPDLLAARINWARILVGESEVQVARGIMDETPEAQRRRPSAAFQRIWILMASGNKEEARRAAHATSLPLPDSPPASQKSGPPPFDDNLRFDLLEYPQGPVFHQTDLELLSFCPHSKGSAQWLAF
jgi:predicted Zn-dependent protease